MDQAKIGREIAALRRHAGLTQEQLGEQLGVSNKTVSRWENGNYMPDLEMLQLLAKKFQITVDALLNEDEPPQKAPPQEADEGSPAAVQTGAFSLEERKAFFKKKWRREHKALYGVLALFLLAACVLSIVFHRPWLTVLVPLLGLLAYCFLRNKMMIYVEDRLYD